MLPHLNVAKGIRACAHVLPQLNVAKGPQYPVYAPYIMGALLECLRMCWVTQLVFCRCKECALVSLAFSMPPCVLCAMHL